MGMDVGGGSGNVKKDINVTPLVDVVLVWLIIFLVTMPVLMRQITIEVPRDLDTQTEMRPKGDTLTFTLKSDGSVVFVQGAAEETIARVQVAQKLRPLLEGRTSEKVVFVDFDYDVRYVDVVSLMDTVKGAGADKIAIKTKEEWTPQ